VATRLSPDAKIIWGAQILKELGETVRAMVIITGVTSPHLFGVRSNSSAAPKRNIEHVLGIDFVK